jgi:hypothetical protein
MSMPVQQQGHLAAFLQHHPESLPGCQRCQVIQLKVDFPRLVGFIQFQNAHLNNQPMKVPGPAS